MFVFGSKQANEKKSGKQKESEQQNNLVVFTFDSSNLATNTTFCFVLLIHGLSTIKKCLQKLQGTIQN